MTIKTRKINAVIRKEDGTIIFEKKDFEIPEHFSDRAGLIMASKYAMESENSAIDIINRVVNQITKWGKEQRYFDGSGGFEICPGSDPPAPCLHCGECNQLEFKNKLKDILLNQRAAFNSPVWFNVGSDTKTNQCSACFILPVEDDMTDILDHCKREGMIFAGGSGVGINISKLRGEGELLSNGGTSSGPLSFNKGFDALAGVIKSGGKTRRSARLVCMDVNHPDIMKFIECKSKEEKKAKILIAGGIDPKEAYETVAYQNANHSVRVTDKFMDAAQKESNWHTVPRKALEGIAPAYNARDILKKIAKTAWETGDPGIQFHDRMNLDNPVPSMGEIRGTNPCFAGETLLHTKYGLRRIETLINEEFDILCHDGYFRKATAFKTGTKKIYKVTLSSGNEILCTEDHRLLSSRKDMSFVTANSIDQKIELGFIQKEPLWTKPLIDHKSYYDAIEQHKNEMIILGYATGDGTPKRIQNKEIKATHNARIYLRKDGDDGPIGELFTRTFNDWKNPSGSLNCLSSKKFTTLWERYSTEYHVQERYIPRTVLEGDQLSVKCFLRGLFSANGAVQPKYNRVSLKTTSKRLATEVVYALSILGIHSYITTNKSKENEFSNGTYTMKESYDVNVSKIENLKSFAFHVSFMQDSKTQKLMDIIEKPSKYKDRDKYRRPYIKSIEFVREDIVYDFTQPDTHTGVANGIVVHNCSEFSAVDNSSCNLASLNLVKYINKEENVFNNVSFREDIKILITAMDILIEAADYPTEKIREVTVATRPLGLGFSNLGAMLMLMGMPYDSEEGRKMASAITREMTTAAYEQSVYLAEQLGPFVEYENNKEKCIEILKRLTNNNGPVQGAHMFGLRNSQLTLLAPTGTISFLMDCDTTGIEPLFALKSTKTMSDGSTMNIVPRCVEQKLEELGNAPVDTFMLGTEDDTITLKKNKEIFQTANEISWKGHIDMMAACQQHLNGAISKTINMPADCTVEDVKDAYIYAWNKGIKSLAIYRDGSKGMQPLTSTKEEKKKKHIGSDFDDFLDEEGIEISFSPDSSMEWKAVRKKLPDTCYGPRHKFSIGGFEGYIRVSTYEDGRPGEMFLNASKCGSMVQGLLDGFATAISLALQYGVPLEHLVEKFSHTRFDPRGMTQNPDIPICSSPLDYIFQWMGSEFLDEDEYNEAVLDQEEAIYKSDPMVNVTLDGSVCNICGGATQRSGTCDVCVDCGATSGCG